MNKFKDLILKRQSFLIATLTFVVLSFATYRYTIYKKGQWEKDIRSNILETLVGKKSNLEKALYSRIYYTRGVAGYVSLNPSISDEEFASLAAEYLKGDSVISTMALSKNCILESIYPLEGHEEAIGLNLLEHPERKEIVEKTIETHKTFVAGPVELVEGGIAFISYTPIFNKTIPGKEEFWGVCDIVIYQDKLIREASLFKTEDDIEFALKGYNGTGEKGKTFWGKAHIFDNDPVNIEIDLPYGNWILAASPKNGWDNYLDQDKVLTVVLFICVAIISILIWLFANSIIKLKISERRLKQANATKDRLFSIIAHDLKNPLGTFVGFTDILVKEFDSLSDEQKKNILSSIQKTAENVYSLLENLLIWSKSQQNRIKIQSQKANLIPLIEEVYTTFKPNAKLKDIKFSHSCSENHFSHIDKELTKTIIRNIVSNAIKFTPKGGEVDISCSIANYKNEKFVSIMIKDNGIGISPEQIEVVSKSGHITSTPGTDNETGTGLGLALAKEFTEKQGGRILIESGTRKGTSVSILLPLID